MTDIKYKCGFCFAEHEYRQTICRPCNARIVYGATPEEVSIAMRLGGITWGVIATVVTYGIPMELNEQFGWHLSNGWGLGIFGLFIMVVAALWGALKGRVKGHESHQGEIRYYR